MQLTWSFPLSPTTTNSDLCLFWTPFSIKTRIRLSTFFSTILNFAHVLQELHRVCMCENDQQINGWTFMVPYMTTQPGGRNSKIWSAESFENVNHKLIISKASKTEIRPKWKRSCRLLLMSESKIRYDLTYVIPTYHFQWILLVFDRWFKEQQFCHVLKIKVVTYIHYQFFICFIPI